MFSKTKIFASTGNSSGTDKNTKERTPAGRLGSVLAGADAVVIGAGAGLSASAGMVYTGERFEKYFADFRGKYGFRDMYSGGFYPYGTLEEILGVLEPVISGSTGIWTRPEPVYENLYRTGERQRLFCADDECGSLLSESRI